MCQKYLGIFVCFCKMLIAEPLKCCCNGKSSLLFSGSCGFLKTAFQKSGYVIDPILLKKIIQFRSGLAFTRLLISGRMTSGQTSVWVSWRSSFPTICSWKSSLSKLVRILDETLRVIFFQYFFFTVIKCYTEKNKACDSPCSEVYQQVILSCINRYTN